METFSNIVFAVLPYSLAFIALIGIVILVLHLRLRHIENQPKEVVIDDGTGSNTSRNHGNTEGNNRN
ncbi:MAG: hypothetical protein IJZ65_07455 [Ruminiclostridium sp.]|nr:hypothetical protein [Ruminiclostridium sp.]